jgi:hypothetical protein
MVGSLLNPRDRFRLSLSSIDCTVGELVGTGGQGEVYEVWPDVAGRSGEPFAFKCYFPANATKDQWLSLSTLIDMGAPDERFLWPSDLAELPDVHTFGYLMALREPRFAGLADLVRRSVTTSFRSIAIAGFQLADSFLALHSRGLCYRDISLGNVFFDPRTGDISICDNDNVTVDGRGHESVLGTTGFLAPEVERLEARPSAETDLYSLSVLLFLLCINHHPLLGERELRFPSLDQAAYASLYGRDPVFIFDPDDASNRPVSGSHDNATILWPLYPRFVREHLTKAFTDGLHRPEARVRESTWKGVMARLRDLIVRCGCGAEVFFDAESGAVAGDPPGRCWSCGGEPTIPPRLRVNGRTTVLNDGMDLFGHHVAAQLYDYETLAASVVRHPADPRIRGLKNRMSEPWEAIEADGTTHRVPPDRSVRLLEGLRIRFADADGDITISTHIDADQGRNDPKW